MKIKLQAGPPGYWQLERARPCRDQVSSYNEGVAATKNVVGKKVAASNPGANKFFSLKTSLLHSLLQIG